MRVYLPATVAELADPAGLAARTGHADTAALAELLPEEDQESREFSAFMAAADAAVDLAGEAGLRVVVSADVPGADPVLGAELPSTVAAPAVAWRQVASIHVDDFGDPAVRDLIRRAATDDDARAAAEDADLLWFDAAERAALVVALG